MPKLTLKRSSLNPDPIIEETFVDLTPEEQENVGNLRVRLERMRDARNQQYPEFGNNTYINFYEENRKKAHTILPPKKNESDVMISAGTLENKLESMLSAVNNLNLSPEVKAFDKKNNRIMLAGIALEDAIFESETLDDDAEKKMLRQKELLIQGTVFIEERWMTRWKKKRKLASPFVGKTKGLDISVELQKYFEGPSRRVVPGPCVYLGDITEYFMKNQPCIATVEIINYEMAESMFRQWDRWEFVSKKLKSANVETPNTGSTSQNAITKWTLNNIGMDEVEMIVYQNKPEDELQILLNGTPMLPVGFPLSAISPNGEYTVEKQVLKAIDNFAYGRGFIQSAEKASDLLDEMLRLSVLKTRKSFMPPYINTSKRVISPRVLNPGQITQGHGMTADSLVPIGKESEGVTASEFQLIKELTDRIDKQTVSQQFAGQQGKSGTTATEVLELQRQAKVTLGLIVFTCGLLEEKAAYLRLYNLLENWYKPISYIHVDGTEIPQYRKTVRPASVPGKGMGERQIIPTSGGVLAPEEIRFLELEEEKDKGFPVTKIFMDPDEMRRNVSNWYIVVVPKEKDTSSTNKLLFREELQDIIALMQFGSRPNVQALEDEYARVWGKDKSKIFAAGPSPEQLAIQAGVAGNDPNQIQGKGRPNVAGVPVKNNVNAVA